MTDDGFSMHSPETDEQAARGQGFDPVEPEGEPMSADDMFIMAQIFTSKTQVMLKLPMIPTFTVAYALAFMISCPSTDNMVRANAEDGFEYFRYILENEFAGAAGMLDRILAEYVKVWADED